MAITKWVPSGASQMMAQPPFLGGRRGEERGARFDDEGPKMVILNRTSFGSSRLTAFAIENADSTE